MLDKRVSLMTVCTSVKCLRMAGFCICWTFIYSCVTIPTGSRRSSGGLSPSMCLTQSGTVFLSGNSSCPTHQHSQPCSSGIPHVLSAGNLCSRSPPNLNKSELYALHLWDPETRVGLLYTHFICMESQSAFNSVPLLTSQTKFCLLYNNLWKKTLRSFPYIQHGNSRYLPAFLENLITNLGALTLRHHRFEVK